MAVRFVIGRAGTGKTSHCLESVRCHLRESPSEGGRLVLLVPEQASLLTERLLVDHPDVGATHRAEVLSFHRLAFRILQHAGVRRRQALSANGRVMVLRHLVGELRDRLMLYRDAERSPGFVERLAQTLAELIHEAVEPARLELPDDPASDDPLLPRRIHDLRLIYAAYLEHLGADRLDPSQYLELARERIGQCDWLADARFWVDGFAGFTGQQKLLLVELAKAAAGIEITAMIDPDYAARAGDQAQVEPTDLFGKIQRTRLDLWGAFVEADVTVDKPLFLTPEPPPRFAGSPVLASLERSLSGSAGTVQAAGEAITLVRAADRRAEVDYVASLICRLVHEGKGDLRYRDIAVILRDVEPYHDLLSAALSARAIPFFLDRRRPMSHHPVVELLRGQVMLVDTPWSLESVRLLLKTGLAGLDDAEADELENYLLACGIQGAAVWRQEADWEFSPSSPLERRSPEAAERRTRLLARINRHRRRFVDHFRRWWEAAQQAQFTGREWAGLLKTVLDEIGVARRLSEWAAQAELDGDLDQAEQHRQLARDTGAFLDDLCVALGDVRMDVRRLDEVLQAGLAQFTLGLAPPMLDQVLIGSVERSRHPEIRVAIVMGFNEGMFPQTGSEDSILNDDDREFLAKRGVRVGVSRRQRVLEEPLLAYTALTRASRNVIVTFAAADQEGKALRESPYLATLRAACPGLEMTAADDVFRGRDPWSVWTSRDLAARLAYEFRHRPSPQVDNARQRTLWNDLYEASRRAEGLDGVLRPALSSLVYRNTARISAASAGQLFSDPLKASVSRLESFAACPFKHFANYALRLRERELSALAEMDAGTIHHAILEQFVRRVVEEQASLADMDDAQVRDRLAASCATVTSSVTSATAGSRARDLYMLHRSAEDLDRVLRSQRRVAQAGRFRPRSAEQKFGLDPPDSLPPLEMTTPAGRKVLLSGFIDRVDLAELADEMLGVVIDYKRTRNKRLDLSEVYHGLSLQLLGYLLVLASHGKSLSGRPIQPAGAFYISLVEGYKPVDHPADSPPAADAFGPRGLLDAARIDTLDSEYTGSGQSGVYNFFRKKDGDLGNLDRTDAAESGDFERLLAHTRRKLGELADGIFEGQMNVLPYRLGTFSPCSWCQFGSVCRFEYGTTDVRRLDRFKRTEVFQKIRQERAS